MGVHAVYSVCISARVHASVCVWERERERARERETEREGGRETVWRSESMSECWSANQSVSKAQLTKWNRAGQLRRKGRHRYLFGAVRRRDQPSSLACINYPPERWALYGLVPDPALLLSHSQRKGWMERCKRERERERERKRKRNGRRGEKRGRERERESQIHCCPDTMTGPREIDHTLALTHWGLCSDRGELPRSSMLCLAWGHTCTDARTATTHTHALACWRRAQTRARTDTDRHTETHMWPMTYTHTNTEWLMSFSYN